MSYPHLTHKWKKVGFLWKAEKPRAWWSSHTMAPTALVRDRATIRLFVGCWQEIPRSEIGWLDIVANERRFVVTALSKVPVVTIGEPGCFDDDGVFPGHVQRMPDGNIWLYYTGFQKSTKPSIDHFNFSGLAISTDGGTTFTKVSEAPILDRADEGLTVRAGLSCWPEVLSGETKYHCVYSAGTGFGTFGGKLRPFYDIYYQQSPDGLKFSRHGQKIISLRSGVEHGLGRPNITKLGNAWYVFYTRRTLDMRYRIGCAWSPDAKNWQRIDEWVDIPHGPRGSFDHEMVYFPSVIGWSINRTGIATLFYCGNGYGRDGVGYAELLNENELR